MPSIVFSLRFLFNALNSRIFVYCIIQEILCLSRPTKIFRWVINASQRKKRPYGALLQKALRSTNRTIFHFKQGDPLFQQGDTFLEGQIFIWLLRFLYNKELRYHIPCAGTELHLCPGSASAQYFLPGRQGTDTGGTVPPVSSDISCPCPIILPYSGKMLIYKAGRRCDCTVFFSF